MATREKYRQGTTAFIGLLLCIVLLWVPHNRLRAAPDTKPIHLIHRTVDPLTLPQSTTDTHVILQVYNPAAASELVDLGVVFLDYISDDAWVVRLPVPAFAVKNHPNVRAITAIAPADKIGRIETDPFDYAILPFPDGDLTALQTILTLNGFVTEQVGGRLEGWFSAEIIPQIAAFPSVYWIQPIDPLTELNDDATWLTQTGYRDHTTLYANGLSGAGQVGAVADSGLAVHDYTGTQTPSCFFEGNGAPSADHRKVVDYTVPADADADFIDGSGHGSHVVGSIAGDSNTPGVRDANDGLAYNARIYFQDIGKNPAGLPLAQINPPTDFTDLFAPAYDPDSSGTYSPTLEPRTHSNSWGSPAQTYNLETAQTDAFAWQHPDFLILFAAGNQGPAAGTVGWPALAKNVVTVGGGENGGATPENLGYFSSHGPTPDGRLKPTITAPGDRILSALAGDPCATVEKSGTSMATPITHAATLLMREYLWNGYYPSGKPTPTDSLHPSAALLKAMLINSGRPLTGSHSDNTSGGTWPSNGQGWGRVTLDDVLYFPGDHRALWLHDSYALDGSTGFDTIGQTETFTLTVGDGTPFATQPLEITLAWSDFAASLLANGALVNDLHLTVTDPLGNAHLGNDPLTNDFHGTPPLTAPDVVNPWEVVYLENPPTGVYTVTVTANRLSSTLLDSRKQPFALVATGDLLDQARLSFQFSHYTKGEEVATVRIVHDVTVSDTITGTITERSGAGETELFRKSSVSQFVANRVGGTPVFTATIPLSPNTETVTATVNVDGNLLTATTRRAEHPLNTALPPTLEVVTQTHGSDSYTVTWTLPQTTTQISHVVIQETVVLTVPVFADGETMGDFAGWSLDGTYAAAGSSFYSGRGDVLPSINTAMTWQVPITLPADLADATLFFYSRYFNDFNDVGVVEISADSTTWHPLRRLYADPKIPPTHSDMQPIQLDLSDQIGTTFYLRFRYDNGVFSQAPESPGWWVDDIAIVGGTWRTVAVAEPDSVQFFVTEQPAGTWGYRVQTVFADGSATAWSAPDAVFVAVPTSAELQSLTTRQQNTPHLLFVALLTVTLCTVAADRRIIEQMTEK